MTTFMISYDLAAPADNKHVLAGTIMTLGTAWARPLEQTWYIRSEGEADDLERALSAFLGEHDGLVVQAVGDDAAMTNTALRWFKTRGGGTGQGGDAGAEIVAFPQRTPAAPANRLATSDLVAQLAKAS